MSDDFPTLSEVGDANIRQRFKRIGEKKEHQYQLQRMTEQCTSLLFGEPVDYYHNYLENRVEGGE